jgi:hypothetical protein
MNIIPALEKRINQRSKAFQMFGIQEKMNLIATGRYWIHQCYGKETKVCNQIIYSQILPIMKAVAPSPRSKQYESFMTFITQIEKQIQH